ncbi:T9SS type A sorting domain-containing protein [Flavobacterium fluviatile]|uniref:T9SS type A sorting domain-containing protein n=1 Tax=Flavobacterium fluviatile TaxID=1862387 RepID=UPI0013D07A68|nr:T9SS type A sorting domain-containing protein [Flavobacterium fluviatile]
MKNLLLFTALLIFNSSHAQFPVWMNSFDSAADLEGWTFHDLNNNGNNWVQGANWHLPDGEVILEAGTEQVLRYTTFPLSGIGYPNASTENDWAISPAIDLTSASGNILLAINWNRVLPKDVRNSAGRIIYISTSPDLAGFQLQEGTFDYYFTSDDVTFSTNPNEFSQSILDISVFAGQTIYVGLHSKVDDFTSLQLSPINIDQIGVFASELLSVDDINASKVLTQIVQNPVASSLKLQLNPAFEPTTTFVKVYNMGGQKVLATPYKDQIEVAALPSGTYIVHITNGTVVEKLKFIKK